MIHPQLNEDDFSLYCPFILPKYLVIAQACFHNFNILCYSSNQYLLGRNIRQCNFENLKSGFMESDLFYLDALEPTNTV